jgi:hypothetical protein
LAKFGTEDAGTTATVIDDMAHSTDCSSPSNRRATGNKQKRFALSSR